MVERCFEGDQEYDNLLNFSRLIMMKSENPFHIDKIIRFLYHEIRVRALVRAKRLKI